MMLYSLVFFSSIFIFYLLKNNFIKLLVILSLFLLSALRDSKIGTDTKTYLSMLHYPNNSLYLKEKGYYYINFLSNTLKLSDNIFLGSLSLFILAPVFYVLLKKIDIKYQWITLWIYLFNPYLYILSNFNILRQGIAMSISLLLLENYLEKKYKKTIFFLLLGMSFHISIFLIFLILILISIINWDKRKIFLLFIFMFIFKILNLFNFFLLFLGTKFLNFQYFYYFNYKKNIFSNNLVTLVYFIFYLIILYLTYSKSYTTKKEKKMVDIFHVTNSLFFFFSLNAVFFRIYIYFYLWNAFIFTIIVKNSKNKLAILIYLIHALLLFLAFYIINSNNVEYFPYRFFSR